METWTAVKTKYRDVKAIYNWYEEYGQNNEDCKALVGTQPSVLQYGYFTPSQANWSYILGYVKYNNNIYKVVTVFGEVRAAQLAQLPEYTSETIRRLKLWKNKSIK